MEGTGLRPIAYDKHSHRSVRKHRARGEAELALMSGEERREIREGFREEVKTGLGFGDEKESTGWARSGTS